jgi:predicted nuclease of predicted toxin-antitoxin system
VIKLFLDANVSWLLASKLKFHFEDCLHVDHIGIKTPASDNEIWKYAQSNDLIIVTNDDDFIDLLNLKGFPPKIILLKTGNQSNEFVEMLLIKHKEEIYSFYDNEENGLLEIFQ